jgi:hypothetical protein
LSKNCVCRHFDFSGFCSGDTSSIGDDLSQVALVGLLKLIFADDLVSAIGAKNVQIEVAHTMF